MEIPGLREARQRRLLTQVELANLVGMTTATISRIETGATKARISTVRKIAEALEMDPTELLVSANSPQSGQQKGRSI
jgi:transcriptional regulator with XRE-family HTH domain